MSDVSKDATLISVHGREALNIPFKRDAKASNGRETQVDISASTIYFEVPAAGLRLQLLPDPGDVKGLLIHVSRTDVEKLPITPTAFAVIDETNSQSPDVEWDGMIKRVGYIGAPTP